MKPSKGASIEHSEVESLSADIRTTRMKRSSLLSFTDQHEEVDALRFSTVKARIRDLLDHTTNAGEKAIKRSGSSIKSEEILKILREMKQPIYGVGLPKHVKVDFMQKYYTEKVMIFGVNKRNVYAFRYREDRSGLPTEFQFLDKMYLNMSKGETYQARSKLDDGFVFCSKEEIFTIRYDPSTGNLRRDLLLLLSNIKDLLDEHSENDGDEMEASTEAYARINDESLTFGEARLFRTEDTEEECVLFSLHSDYSINKEGGTVEKHSSMALIYKFGQSPRIMKYLETSGHIWNLTMVIESLKANKLYYLMDNMILENYLKSFGVRARKGKMGMMSDRFNYEKKVYQDSNLVQQFEFDGKKKFLISLSEGKVKKLNKYDKKAVPVYFEQENPVDDFAVSGNYIYTGDKNTTLNIWNSITEKKLNNLPLNILHTDSLITLAELEEEEPYEPDPDEDPFDRLIDIIVNDDYSELVVILKDMILFWNIPTIFSEVNVGRNISSRSAVCLQRHSNNMLLNCGNLSVITLRRDSLKKLDSRDLPKHSFFVKLTAYEDYFIAFKETASKETENPFFGEEETFTGENVILRRRRGLADVEVFRTELEITSLEVVYRSQLEACPLFKNNNDLNISERLDAGPTPEIAMVILLDGEELMLVILDADAGQIEAKNLNRLSPDDPQFMQSSRGIVISKPDDTEEGDLAGDYGTMANNDVDSSSNFLENGGKGNVYGQMMTPVYTRPKNSDSAHFKFSRTETMKGKKSQASYRHFEFFPKIGYFLGYLEEIGEDGLMVLHFVMLNPFRKMLTKLVLPNVYREKEAREDRKISYRFFCQQIAEMESPSYSASQVKPKKTPKKKPRSKETKSPDEPGKKTMCFYTGLTSQMGTVIVRVDLFSGKITKHGEFPLMSHRGASAQVCGRVNHLYIPEKNRIEVFDLECCDRIYSIELEGEVLDIYKGKSGKLMAAIDMNFLYTIDVSTLQIINRMSLSNRKMQSKMMIFDMNFFWEMREIQIPEFSQDVTMLKKVDLTRLSGLRYLPVDHLANCFSKQDNQKSIFAFADYYSYAVDKMGGHDFLFGPLNPYTLAIFYSEELILLRILEQYTYPLKVVGFLTPIEYCVQNEENDCLRILCTMLIKKKIKVFMTYREFKALLDLDYTFCHDLLAMAPRKIPFDKLNFAGNVKNDVEMKFSESLFDFMIENERLQQVAENEASEVDQEVSRQRVEIFYVPFKYEMHAGSRESLDFLENYTSSPSHDFILSKWRHLIFIKWSKLRFLFAFNAVIFWIYMFFCTYSIVFNIETDGENNITGEKQPWVRYCALAMNILITLLELFQMLAYCIYNPKIYFGDFWNYVDIFALGFAFVFFMKLYKITGGDSPDYVALILMLLIYYRGFSYFRYFSSFISMIGMINTIVASSVSFFGTLFYAYFSIFFLFIRADPGRSIVSKLRDAYIFLLFGGLEQPHFFPRIIMFPMIVGTMVVTIILLNVLIAFMSNVYNQMEQLQEITALKERSSMLLDLEVYISLFRTLKEACGGVRRDPVYRDSQRNLVFWFQKIEGVQGSSDRNNTFAKIAKMEVDVARLGGMMKGLTTRNEKDFTSLKKKIKGINKFFGYHQNEVSHFDAKMHSLMISLFENFGVNVANSVRKRAEEHPVLKKAFK